MRTETMKVVQCEQFGSHLDLQVREVARPGRVAADEIKVAVESRGIAFSDLVRIQGGYRVKSSLPFVVGVEGAGVVVEVGSLVTGLSLGDKVLVASGCVEEINVKAGQATRLPANVDLDAAAAFRSNYLTAYQGLELAHLQPGETLLVHGAGGGVGLAAVDLGKHYGARVIGVASSDDKRAVVTAMGADYAIDSAPEFREQVKALTQGRGADVIYDPVGGDIFDESMRCIAPFGRLLVVGFTSGRPALAKTNHLLVKDASVIGYTVGGLQKHKPALAAQYSATLLDWLANKRIKPFISHKLPMEEAIEGYQLLVDRKVAGKVILTSTPV